MTVLKHSEAFGYDANGYLSTSTNGVGDPSARTTHTTFDGNGNVATTTDGDNNVATNTYDADGNVLTTEVQDGDGAIISARKISTTATATWSGARTATTASPSTPTTGPAGC